MKNVLAIMILCICGVSQAWAQTPGLAGVYARAHNEQQRIAAKKENILTLKDLFGDASKAHEEMENAVCFKAMNKLRRLNYHYFDQAESFLTQMNEAIELGGRLETDRTSNAETPQSVVKRHAIELDKVNNAISAIDASHCPSTKKFQDVMMGEVSNVLNDINGFSLMLEDEIAWQNYLEMHNKAAAERKLAKKQLLDLKKQIEAEPSDLELYQLYVQFGTALFETHFNDVSDVYRENVDDFYTSALWFTSGYIGLSTAALFEFAMESVVEPEAWVTKKRLPPKLKKRLLSMLGNKYIIPLTKLNFLSSVLAAVFVSVDSWVDGPIVLFNMADYLGLSSNPFKIFEDNVNLKQLEAMYELADQYSFPVQPDPAVGQQLTKYVAV